MQESGRSPKVAVLDTIHGAGTIARRMVECGINAVALEVYHHQPSVSDFDLIAAPVHLPPSNPVLAEALRLHKKIITHHQAVGELMASSVPPDLQIFEVTGTHSKTSTALLLAKILSWQKLVLTHTTRGLELWRNGKESVVKNGLSITPGNVIIALDESRTQGAEALISEISLGGTGLADWGILTSFSGDYRIAKETKWASTAKLQLVSLAKKGAHLATNTDVPISSDISFGESGQVQARPDRLLFADEDLPLSLSEDLDYASYQTAIAAAGAVARSAGISGRDIARALQDFDGFSGRMKVRREGGITIYDSSNSGLKVRDVNLALDRARGPSLGVVVGEDAETVCEGMNIPGLLELLRARRDEIKLLVLVGERLAPYAKDLRASWARNLAAGQEAALASSSLDRLLLCVKCFR
ncbi:MAG: coenzyme F430 synthase [Methanothrix sp.]|nr:MAG: coenzyme F430 synthase [Methanothrix sp.]